MYAGSYNAVKKMCVVVFHRDDEITPRRLHQHPDEIQHRIQAVEADTRYAPLQAQSDIIGERRHRPRAGPRAVGRTRRSFFY